MLKVFLRPKTRSFIFAEKLPPASTISELSFYVKKKKTFSNRDVSEICFYNFVLINQTENGYTKSKLIKKKKLFAQLGSESR